jgi:Zn2+/Cd2+-exporting ATPase
MPAPPQPEPRSMPRADDHGCGCCHAPMGPAREATLDPGSGQLQLRIPELDCPVEVEQVRRALEGLPGVGHLAFDVTARSLRVEAPASSWASVQAAIRKAGFTVEPLSDAGTPPPPARSPFLKPGLALMAALAAEVMAEAAPGTLPWKGAGLAVAALAIVLSGFSVFRKGVASLLRGQLNINALMSVAVAGAFLIGEWPEAAMVMALYALAELIEARAVQRARHAIQSLLDLSPQDAEVQQADGHWATQPAKDVSIGAIVRVRPGERFALDGRVRAGRSTVDQSPVTGESLPVDKGPGDEVFAGTINQEGSLEFEVLAPAGDTVLARIIHAVEEAEDKRAPTQRFVDRFAAVTTPVVLVLALLIASLGPLMLGWPWLTGIYKALVILVIACPCALVLSTPVTVVSGLAAATRRGILIKGGAFLERARTLKAVALDKTGTVTEGRPRLVAQVQLAGAGDRDGAFRIAAALAGRSDHPVSLAIAEGLAIEDLPPVEGFGAEAGRGVRGSVLGRSFILGNHRWIHDQDLCTPELEAAMDQHERLGRTVTVLADGTAPLAFFAVADTLRPHAGEAVAELVAMGIHPVLLTGDNPVTATTIATQAGIREIRANLLPQDKLQAIQVLASELGPVAMVGDGINDAPALASADLGFAMGEAGTHTALEAADVVIMNDDLRRIPETIRLSRRTHAVLWQNFSLALGIKLAVLVLAVFDHATMWMAVFADMGASLLVVFNGLRLLGGARSRN